MHTRLLSVVPVFSSMNDFTTQQQSCCHLPALSQNSMPPSLKPRRQASMSAPRPSAGAATVCCGWYPSITVRRSSRSAITVVPWCAHGQHTNCLMKCMIEVYRYLWIERVTGSSFEVGLDDLKLSGNNDQILQKKTLEDSIIGTC
uniref:Uncharacterized protein n=1 Tax=Oryza nivara TaxID=4536 RepID=A0A0E0HEZ3_ORYNI